MEALANDKPFDLIITDWSTSRFLDFGDYWEDTRFWTPPAEYLCKLKKMAC